MSEKWKLENLDTTPDINDVYSNDVYSKTQLRKHYIFTRHILVNADNYTFVSSAGSSTSLLAAYIGDAIFQLLLMGGAKWICTYDGLAPQDDYRVFAYRKQTWEYYGPWTDAPAGWNLATSEAGE